MTDNGRDLFQEQLDKQQAQQKAEQEARIAANRARIDVIGDIAARIREEQEAWIGYVANSRADVDKRNLAIRVFRAGARAAVSAGRELADDPLEAAAQAVRTWTGPVSQLRPESAQVEPFFDRLIDWAISIRNLNLLRQENAFSPVEAAEDLRGLDSILSELQLARLNEFGSRAKDVLADTQAAAGQVGSSALNQSFDEFASRQLWWIISLWILMTGLTAAVIAAGASVVFSPKFSELTIGEVLGRATLTVPVLALATYFGRQASLFADARRRAHEAAVRLKAIGAFTAEMSAEQRANVFEMFSRTLFGRIDWSQPEDSQMGLDAVKTLLEAVPKLTGKG
ncbi:MAG: hypothetical protein HY830_11875 [Actinobacteria bacterium]|nr:hypothetical protein [Actinomycetota bacterium]